MNVNNRLFKIFCLFVLFNLYYSCKYNNNKDEEENTYQILSLLLNEYTANSKKLTFTIPPPPNGTKSKYNFSVKDSLSLYKRFYEETIKQKVIALESKMFEMNEKYYFKEDCNVNQKLLQSFFNLKHSKNINLDKIVLHKKDSLIYYTDNHRKMQTRGFDEIDICLNFSRISFDRNHKQAILILGISYSKLNGFSAMYFLEKRKGNWYIKCVKELGIS
jgi:hypothetical protein